MEHPKFHHMIDVASRAPTGVKVKIPDRKATRRDFIESFKRNLKDLRDRLNVSTII